MPFSGLPAGKAEEPGNSLPDQRSRTTPANWILVGSTQGRGKLDRFNEYKLPVKNIYLYPLVKNFRAIILGLSPQ